KFVLSHEAFHLRCFDPLMASLSKSMRWILAFAGSATCGLIAMELTRPITSALPATSLWRIAVTFLVGYAVFQRLGRADVAFHKHKELLADRFAFGSQPEVDLDLVY